MPDKLVEQVAGIIRDFKIGLGGERYKDDFPDKLAQAIVAGMKVNQEKLKIEIRRAILDGEWDDLPEALISDMANFITDHITEIITVGER